MAKLDSRLLPVKDEGDKALPYSKMLADQLNK